MPATRRSLGTALTQLRNRILPPELRSAHALVMPLNPGMGPPLSDELMELVVSSLAEAYRSRPTTLVRRIPLAEDKEAFMRWPGEHYRFLMGLTSVMRPKLAVEIGTFRGLSALAMSKHSQFVTTFDVTALRQIPDAVEGLLAPFSNVTQIIDDLSHPASWAQHDKLFEQADLVLVDGPKDRTFEEVVVPRILKAVRPGTVVVLDDVRFRNMQVLWRDIIEQPRLDLGCLAHGSGTGILMV